MVKIVDIDELFDKYISGYVYSNIGKVKPEEIENNIPVLYNEFGDKPLAELDGKTPNAYYRDFKTEELLSVLKTHLERKVAVSDFLCEAIEKGDISVIAEELKNENSEEYTLYLMNFIEASGKEIACDKLLDFILWDYSAPVRELATEILNKHPEKVKDRILSSFFGASEEKKACLAEILSHAEKDEEVFGLLIGAFKESGKSVALYAGYLGKYGDERAIPYLISAADDEKIDYADFEEIRFNIELLGGEYKGKRDFSKDKTRKKLQGAKNVGIVGKR